MIETQPVPEHVATALAALRRIDEADPDLEACLRAVEAETILCAVRPLYPPASVTVPRPRLVAGVAIVEASAALRQAIDAATHPAEAVRFAAALAALGGETLAGLAW